MLALAVFVIAAVVLALGCGVLLGQCVKTRIINTERNDWPPIGDRPTLPPLDDTPPRVLESPPFDPRRRDI
jgi:hypothetical protein